MSSILRWRYVFCFVLCAGGGFAQTQTRSTPQPILNFESVLYAMFASPYPDLSRDFTTSTTQAAEKLLRLPLTRLTPSGYKLFGTWTIRRALVERAVRADGPPSPAALLLYMRSGMGSADRNAGIAITIGRWQGSRSALATYEQKLDRASFTRHPWKNGTIFSSCRSLNIVLEDYPMLRQEVKSYCRAEYRDRTTFIRVEAVNLNEQIAVKELRHMALFIGLPHGK